jgi:hypothetical protein
MGGADEVFIAIVRGAWPFGGIEVLVWATWIRSGCGTGVISGAQPAFFLPGLIGAMSQVA